MGKPRAPRAPDPIATGAAQTGTNVSTAIANQIGAMVNQNTPYGSLTYDQTGTYTFTDPNSGRTYELPRFTANQTLTPQGQVIQNNTVQAQQNMSQLAATQTGRLNQLMGQGLTTQGLPGRGTVPTLGTMGAAGNLQGQIANAGGITRDYQVGDTSRYERALMDRMAPSLEQSRAARTNELRQQGITPGSAAFDRAMAQVGQQENDARYGAILNAGQEQSRIAGLNAQRAAFQNAAQGQQFQQNAAQLGAANAAMQGNFNNRAQQLGFNNAAETQQYQLQQQARQNALQERVGIRNQNLNEIQALMGGSQVQSPNFVNTPGLNMPTTDYAGLIQQNFANQNALYGQQMGAWNGLWGGLMGGAASLGTGWLMGR